MSAFIVSKTHIDVLLTAALELEACGVTKDTADRVGTMLGTENVRSVLTRYPALRQTQDGRVHVFRRRPSASYAIVAKSLDCYEYQCTETEDWPSTEAARFVCDLRSAILQRLDGYEAAPWGIDEEGR